MRSFFLPRLFCCHVATLLALSPLLVSCLAGGPPALSEGAIPGEGSADTPSLPSTPATGDGNADVVGAALSTEGNGEYLIAAPFKDSNGLSVPSGVTRGTMTHLTLDSSKSAFYNGLDSTLNSPNSFVRDMWTYVPAGAPNTELAVMVIQDGAAYTGLSSAFDTLIAAGEIPPMFVLFINPGPGDGRGSERGLEYDTVSEAYARFIDEEALPFAAAAAGVRLSSDPNLRGTMGGSSGGAAALFMAFCRPDLFTRVLSYSGTFVNQHPDKAHPASGWELPWLVLSSPKQNMRIFFEVGQNDLNLDTGFGDGQHEWVAANQRLAVALRSRAYPYRFVYALGAGHVDGGAVRQTFPDALRWLWRGARLTDG